jgi:hypothetical protein
MRNIRNNQIFVYKLSQKEELELEIYLGVRQTP